MIQKGRITHFRNPEHYQFMHSADSIFLKYRIDPENLEELYFAFGAKCKEEEVSLAVEKGNEKIREKNGADRYRDRLHSKLFNQVKAITYDEKDTNYDAAQRVMNVIREVGNPTKLAEDVESAMLTTLGNRLEPYRDDLQLLGVQDTVDKLMETNRQFIALEKECREMSALNIGKVPSVSAIRKEIDPIYRSIVNAINGYAGVPSKKEAYKEIIAEMNTLVDKYEALLSARKSNDGDKDEDKNEDKDNG